VVHCLQEIEGIRKKNGIHLSNYFSQSICHCYGITVCLYFYYHCHEDALARYLDIFADAENIG